MAEPAADADIWFVERRRDGNVRRAGARRRAGEHGPRRPYPSLTPEGAIYYARWDGATGDLFRARPVSGGYEVERVAPPVNIDAVEYDPYISPDEGYLLFASSRPGGAGGADLYISVRAGDAWSEPRNLGLPINSPARDYGPIVSPDGKYFFFTSKRPDAPDGGRGNVYWMTMASLQRTP